MTTTTTKPRTLVSGLIRTSVRGLLLIRNHLLPFAFILLTSRTAQLDSLRYVQNKPNVKFFTGTLGNNQTLSAKSRILIFDFLLFTFDFFKTNPIRTQFKKFVQNRLFLTAFGPFMKKCTTFQKKSIVICMKF